MNCEYAADAVKDFHNGTAAINRLRALSSFAYRFVDFF
jgi:hypothetical protein